jgi:heptosyltransferase III
MTFDGAPDAASLRRILIHRLGSIGDTMVALPALKLIARRFPDAERIVLTGAAPVNGASMATLLDGSGLAHGYIDYVPGERRIGALYRLARTIRALRADALIYLTEPKGRFATWRDVAFFHACGVKRIIGAPLSHDLRTHRPSSDGKTGESEAARLARCIAELGDARLDDPASWVPFISDDEDAEAARILSVWPADRRFIALAVGARAPARDWGEDRWSALIDRLENERPDLGLMLFGGPSDRPRAERLAAGRRIPVLDRCDRSPADLRVSLALLRRACLTVAANGGPMHMAAGLGVPVVAVFSAFYPPGVWAPAGNGHAVFLPQVSCVGCGPAVCARPGEACIRMTTADAVFAACAARLPPPSCPPAQE